MGEDEEIEECVEEEDEEPVELTPAQSTFTDEKPETLYMAPTPSQVGADGRLLSLPIRCELNMICSADTVQVATGTAAATMMPRFGGRRVRWQHLFYHLQELPSVSSPC